MKPPPKEKIDEILSLHRKGFRMIDISRKTGVKYHSARGIVYRRIGGEKRPTKEEIEAMKRNICEDRKTMTNHEVAKKYKRSVRYINDATSDHPDKHLFVRKNGVVRKQSNESKLFRSDGMEKGHIKLKKQEKVLPTKIYDPKQQRSVPLNDGKNTLIFVNINDPRSNDEVRKAFIEKNER